MLRDGILRSKKIASLDPMAELFYRRLMSVADDFGRYYAEPALLLSDCFPIRPSWADENGVVGWLEACRTCGLIQVYEVNGTAFLEIQNFGQRTRPGQVSKFPALAVNCGGAREKPAFARASTPPTPTTTTAPPTPSADFSLEEPFERMYVAHPNKAGRILAQQALADALSFAADQAALVAKIEAAHQFWLPEFQRNGGKYCPQLHRWITDQKYLDDPPAPAEEEYDWRKAARA